MTSEYNWFNIETEKAYYEVSESNAWAIIAEKLLEANKDGAVTDDATFIILEDILSRCHGDILDLVCWGEVADKILQDVQ